MAPRRKTLRRKKRRGPRRTKIYTGGLPLARIQLLKDKREKYNTKNAEELRNIALQKYASRVNQRKNNSPSLDEIQQMLYSLLNTIKNNINFRNYIIKNDIYKRLKFLHDINLPLILILYEAEQKDVKLLAEDLKQAGYTASEIAETGYTLSELLEAGFTKEDLKGIDFSREEYVKAKMEIPITTEKFDPTTYNPF